MKMMDKESSIPVSNMNLKLTAHVLFGEGSNNMSMAELRSCLVSELLSGVDTSKHLVE
jgi:hypothetical protein